MMKIFVTLEFLNQLKRRKGADMTRFFVLLFVGMAINLSAQTKELKSFYDNGIVKSVYRYSSTQDYEFTNYYPSGKVMESGRFVNGKMDGLWTSWSESGIKTAESRYTNGERNGEWRVYDESGALRYKVVYDANKIVSTTGNAPSKSVAQSAAH